MGEYGKFNGSEIKIGTCEMMYYLRWEDRLKIEKLPNSLDPKNCDGLFWRLPFADEDENGPGNYKNHKRGFRLWKRNDWSNGTEDFCDESAAEYPGTIQLRSEGGLLANVNCYHGVRLPEDGKETKFFWNGKSWSFELMHVKNMSGKLFPIVGCRHCGNMWRYEWDEVLPFVNDDVLKARLKEYSKLGIEKAA